MSGNADAARYSLRQKIWLEVDIGILGREDEVKLKANLFFGLASPSKCLIRSAYLRYRHQSGREEQ